MSRGIVPLITLATVMVAMGPYDVAAHDVPTDILVQAFVKPEGQRLNVLVRVPLRAILDVDIPKRGPGYLDLGRAEPSLREGATGWIAGSIELYEELDVFEKVGGLRFASSQEQLKELGRLTLWEGAQAITFREV